jgi:Uma2 family endonuclease
MSALPQQKLTPQEYLAIERGADFKSEFFDGEVFAMAGTSKEHSRITVNLTIQFGNALKGWFCEPFSSDLRVKVSANGLYTYPDLTIVCGPVDVEDEQADVLLNPTLIIEVLSPGTERYDRGKKFDLYRELDSLKEYVLVSQDQYRVEQFLRGNGSEWGYRVAFKEDDIVEFPSVGCSISIKDIYARVAFSFRRSGSSRGVVGTKEKTGTRIRSVFCVGEIMWRVGFI